jgi:hypothetical protein
VERDDDIAKVGRTLIGMDEEHRERDFVLYSRMDWKPVKTG